MKHQVIKLPSVESTNNYAAKMLRDGLSADITVILTFNQTAGRGQRGNTWSTEAGKDLAISFLCRQHIHPKQAHTWSLWFTLFVIQFFQRHYGIALKAKWPNDLLHEQKKLAGILIENQLTGAKISSNITGIGINVNSLESLTERATSMSKISGKNYDLDALAQLLIEEFTNDFLGFSQQHPLSLKNLYHRYMFGYGSKRMFKDKEQELFEAEVLGINDEGLLLLKRTGPNATVQVYDIKDLSWILD